MQNTFSSPLKVEELNHSTLYYSLIHKQENMLKPKAQLSLLAVLAFFLFLKKPNIDWNDKFIELKNYSKIKIYSSFGASG